MSLKDRLLTRPVAEAMMSPSGILLAGAGAAIGVAAGGGVVVAAALGVAAWAGRVAAGVPRGPVRPRIDQTAVEGQWRAFVDDALAAQRRFEAVVERTTEGPLRDRLADMSDRIDAFVRQSYEVARSGQALSEARSDIDVDQIVADLHRVTGGQTPKEGSTKAQAAASLEAQLASARRLSGTIDSTRDRLMLLDARLDEAVTRAIELSVASTDPVALGVVVNDIDGLVDELEAVRQALAVT